ncbi:hypothetical protein DBO85_11620 [Pseudomonas mangrovi]|uniref:Uncharacterized protein n=1 Tax=Pseudomonas mangrovi TaxID=2161748 RepID=A0A2T5P8E7_9PSED|nr:hypothetical protein DBO85_11620 [Pseudomonas mangrovi]
MILLTQRFIGRVVGWHGCPGPEGRPCNCVRQGKCPVEFGVRDCTQGSGATQGSWLLALTVPYPPPSMPRNLTGVTPADATPGLLPRGG